MSKHIKTTLESLYLWLPDSKPLARRPASEMSGEEAAEDFEENLLMKLGLSKGQLILLNIQVWMPVAIPEGFVKNISIYTCRLNLQNVHCCKTEVFCHMTKLWLMARVISEYDFDIL